jgi:magnesium-protoporphyrin O-methyltransferase
MMAGHAPTLGYENRRQRLETYFDRTAVDAWEKLTSDAPVSGIRATVRAGRDAMRDTLLSWLPADLRGKRLLDAGCGTGALAVEAARRGASVVAVDVSPNLIEIARSRAPAGLEIDWQVGDMLSADHGAFHHVVAMDSLIHYAETDVIAAVEGLRGRAPSVLFTFAPRTPLLLAMQAAGKLFPRGDRSPAIVPVAESRLRAHFGNNVGRTKRIDASFYKSQAMEIFAQ